MLKMFTLPFFLVRPENTVVRPATHKVISTQVLKILVGGWMDLLSLLYGQKGDVVEIRVRVSAHQWSTLMTYNGLSDVN